MDTLSTVLFIAVGFVFGFFIRKLTSEKNLINKKDFDKINDQKNEIKTERDFLLSENENIKEEIKNLKEENKNNTKVIAEITADKASAQEKNKHLEQKISELEEKIKQYIEKLEKLTLENQTLVKQNAQIVSEAEVLKQNAEKAENIERQNKKDIDKLRTELSEQRQLNTKLTEQNKKLEEILKEKEENLKKIGQAYTNEFKVLAQKILDEAGKKFETKSKQEIENILKPLEKDITEFKKQVEEAYGKEAKERFSLEQRIKELAELNQTLTKEANNLTQALKGSAKVQGNWGEMILEKILENSGLTKNREYFLQETLLKPDGTPIKDEQGHRKRPDVIVKYPDDRHIIIDSKVSLTAYERYVSADDDQTRNQAISEHIFSIKKHIDELSNKNYDDYDKSLDFVMLFVPVEPAYMVAVQHEPTLWDYAYKKRIILISPTNLIAALKLVADLWKREYQNRNAIAIADRGAQLYDKFVNFATSLIDIGNHIEKANNSYNKAMNQLKTGSGNILSQIEKLKELGVKAKKQLPPKLTE